MNSVVRFQLMRGPLNAGSIAPGLMLRVDLQLMLPRCGVRHRLSTMLREAGSGRTPSIGGVEIQAARQARPR